MEPHPIKKLISHAHLPQVRQVASSEASPDSHRRSHVEELKEGITGVLKTDIHDMLQQEWQELEYRLDVCRVTSGARIEHF